nr:hypothetical protein [Methanobrevibacter sp.]
MAIMRVSGTCDSGSIPDRTIFIFFELPRLAEFMVFLHILILKQNN